MSGGFNTFWVPKSHALSSFACRLLDSPVGPVDGSRSLLPAFPTFVPSALACRLGLKRPTLGATHGSFGVGLGHPATSWTVHKAWLCASSFDIRSPRFCFCLSRLLLRWTGAPYGAADPSPRRKSALGLFGVTQLSSGGGRMGPAAFGRLATLVRAKPRAVVRQPPVRIVCPVRAPGLPSRVDQAWEP